MKILVINTGSSSIKYRLFDMIANSTLASGMVERIGEGAGRAIHTVTRESGVDEKLIEEATFEDHRAAMTHIVQLLAGPETGVIDDMSEIDAVGHRVVHGGEDFTEPTLIDERVIDAVKKNIPLAPLHNPPNLTGIQVAMSIFKDTPHIAVFDTAFHQTIPPKAFLYGLPYDYYETHRIRRYGFHGTSHFYVAKEAAKYLGKPLEGLNMITIHLGNGSSITAVEKGRSVDTSMGMTPLEGLMMGTRAGDMDPSIYFYLSEHLGMSIAEIQDVLNKESGLKGIAGVNDMREILQRSAGGDKRAELAIEMFCYRIRKYIGAYFAVLGNVDAVVFTAGVGENSPEVRAKSCEGLEAMGIVIDPGRNNSEEKGIIQINDEGGAVKVLVVPTNEELEIARQTIQVIDRS